MTRPVGVALVGMGWWGKKMLNVLAAAPSDIRVVRAVEPNLETARALCAEKGVALMADYVDALSDPDVEAVVLATPHALHGAQIEAAVAAGKHIFCEKPLALTKAGAEKAVRLCRDAGLVLGMGHERRWEPPVAELLARADAGDLGRIHQIEANFSHDKFLALDRDNWRLKADQAPAGGMTATGIHLLDLSVRLLGPAQSVWCVCEQLSSDLPQGDTVAAYVKFRGGGTSYVSASLANPFVSRLAVFGSKGWIDIRDKAHVEAPDGWVVTTAKVGGPITTAEAPAAEPVKDNLVSFARAVRGVERYRITAEHLVNNIALLEAVFASARSGKIETVA
jgi:predicted dehydrogenase